MRIRIVCREPFHDGRTYPVETFERLDGEWFDYARRVSTVLTGNEPGGDRDAETTRLHYRLDCRCGWVVVARAESLHPVLDRLESAEVPVVTLREVAARAKKARS